MTTNVRDKTDAFACLVFEDAILMTDVIGDCLSPRWPSWSQRAFAFNIGHPSSTLQIGVFDFDPELSPLQMLQRAAADIHDPIGRIQLHLSTFRPAVEYTLAVSVASCHLLYIISSTLTTSSVLEHDTFSTPFILEKQRSSARRKWERSGFDSEWIG